MSVEYDNYYQTENLFGKPYPELIDFYSKISQKGKLLDLGCGQGRDAIPLAKLGYRVTGIDNSEVGIEQLNFIAETGNLPLLGVVSDIFKFSNFSDFEFILLDSMFHFGKKERKKEIDFLTRILEESKPGTLITICIQNTGKKVEILNGIILDRLDIAVVDSTQLIYNYVDSESNHQSQTKYEMITVEKLKHENKTQQEIII